MPKIQLQGGPLDGQWIDASAEDLSLPGLRFELGPWEEPRYAYYRRVVRTYRRTRWAI